MSKETKSVMPKEAIKDQSPEKLTAEEMLQIKEAKTESVFAATLAEKAYAQASVAELKAKNLILTIFNKYGLNLENGDNILEDGTIRRAKKEEK